MSISRRQRCRWIAPFRLERGSSTQLTIATCSRSATGLACRAAALSKGVCGCGVVQIQRCIDATGRTHSIFQMHNEDSIKASARSDARKTGIATRTSPSH